MAQTKATKKFQKHHLKDTLKRRKEFAKVKQKHQLRAKKKTKRQAEKSEAEDIDVNSARTQQQQQQRDKDEAAFNNMSVDEFFAGGFELPQKAPSARQRSGKRKRPAREDAEDDDDSGADEASSVASIEEHASMEASDEEEGDGAEDGGADAMELHGEELKTLAKNDPEFYKYLQENDAELLNFAEDSALAEVDELSGGEDDDEDTTGEAKKKTRKDSKGIPEPTGLTIDIVEKWTTAMAEQRSLRSMREMVLAFRAAAHLNDEGEGKEYKYNISNADVYNLVLLGALNAVPAVLNHHLPVKELASGKIRIATESKKFRTLTPLLKSHATSLLHLLENLSDAATIKTTLGSMLSLLPYLLSFKKLVRELARAAASIWSSPSAHDEATRISAFLVLRRLAVAGDPGIREDVLRTSYQALLKGSRSTTQHTLAGINLAKNSAAELWGLVDAQQAYATGFTLVRQLAVHLRAALKDNRNDSYKAVYNWQYVHALDFWSRVLALHCDAQREAASGARGGRSGESALRPLIYPLTQVTLGALRLIPTAAYFPLRFQLARALLRLSRATHTFIPLAAALHEVLASAEMKRAPKPATLRPLDFAVAVRAPAGYLRTRVYQDGVGEQVVELLGEFFALWCKSVAFPELALPVVVMLKRWLKDVSPFAGAGAGAAAVNGNGRAKGKGKRGARDGAAGGGNKNAKVNSAVSLLVQKLDANARFIEEKRAKVDFAPNNRAGVEGFLKELEWNKTPFGAYVEGQRAQREEKRLIVEDGRRAEERKRERTRAKAGERGGAQREGFESEDEDADDMELDEEEEQYEDEDDDDDDVLVS